MIEWTLKGGAALTLNGRSQQILNEIASNRRVTSATIAKKYGLTRRQISYAIEKINEWLQREHIPEIERTRQGHFIVDQSVFSKITGKQDYQLPDGQGFLTEEQRVHFILLMLLAKKEELSLLHFHSQLGYSKNTILNDLKKVQEFVSPFQLVVRYSRKHGYLLEGKELQIRKLLIHLTEVVVQTQTGRRQLEIGTDIGKHEISEVHARIEKVEQKLGIQFTDEKLMAMPYILTLVLKRISIGHVLPPFPIEYDELSDTKEYQATEEIFRHLKDVPKQERLFVTLYLLTTSRYWTEWVNAEEALPDLVPALADVLRLFEKSACIYLQERDLLLKKLIQHIKPAYYRMKYELTAVEAAKPTLSDEYKELHHLVKRSLGPLERQLGKPMPEAEKMYVTMLIGSWMMRQGESINKKIKAIVVCPQGVSVSGFMLKELSELFPEFVFLDSLSVREFQTCDLAFDLVFSQTPLETNKRFYMTSSLLRKEDRARLRRQVMEDVYGYAPVDFNVNAVIEIVRNHALITDESGLQKQLQQYFFPNHEERMPDGQAEEKQNLQSFIKPDSITFALEAPSWEEALSLAAQPLLDQGKIEQRYVEALMSNKERDPYIIIGPHIAIPHASPEEGAIEAGMSLLHLRKPVLFSDDEWVHVMVVIAAIDKHRHIRALRQLIKLAGSKEARERLIAAKTETEIMELVSFYSKD
ncbi:BglG family transcription antiterminator [Shouchella clausii]|uniref:BglG family transcription antiterminator n=1 Tax=Shouchella clausii TaxID=79880 RepID=UPI0020D049DE|nr:BglG family transcription antiterminator [Shouchella clausii]